MWQRLLFIIYTFGIHLGNFFIYSNKFLNNKINQLYKGRRDTLNRIRSNNPPKNNPIWIHCASLGEFEQGRPLIEAIKSTYPDEKIILSFFSPSGYEIRKNYPYADEIIYLPSDLPENNRRLLEYYNPKILILVKYEFWWNLIREVQQKHIPIISISGVFRNNDYFLKQIVKPFRNLLIHFEMIFVQDEASEKVLSERNFHNVEIAGDTRIDSVLNNLNKNPAPKRIHAFVQGKKTIIYGSVWLSDIHMAIGVMQAFPDYKHIIVPHDVRPENIDNLRRWITDDSRLYSESDDNTDVLIIDNIGMLSSLYAVADYVYIGGGFRRGIHNILEPLIYRIPVFFGPKYNKFNEAVTLNEQESVFPVRKCDEMIAIINQWEGDTVFRDTVKTSIEMYFEQNRGATHKILDYLKQIIEI